MVRTAFGVLGRASMAAVLVTGLAACSSSGAASPGKGIASMTSGPAEGPVGSVWVAVEGSNDLLVLDAATSTVVTTVSGISEPHNVQVAPDGNRTYAVSGDAAMVAELDPATYRLIAAQATGPAPAHVVLTPDGTTSYVTNYGDGTVSAYQADDLTPTTTIRVGGGPHGLRPTPTGRLSSWLT